MAIKTLRVFAEFTSTGFVPMPTAGNIDYGYTLASTFPSSTPSSFQTDDPDLDVTVTAMTDFYVWIRINGTAWNPSYTRNVRVYPDSPDINNVVMNMIIATGPAGTSAYSQIVQTSNRLYFNGATTDSVYNSKFAGKTYINELNFGTAPQLATVATSGAYADLTGKPALSTVATSGLYTDLSAKPSGTAPISYNSGTNSFQITQAGASTNGSLSSADWNTFNNKQGTITLTTSGTSGASTLVGNTLNIPNYAPNLSVYVPYTGATTNVNLGTHSLTAADLIVNHVSGSGVAASITKGGNGEALTVVKTSGSGNAASITGGVTLLDELHLNTDLADAYIASATNWNTAYTNRIVSASAPLSITSNAISISQANTSTNGFLSSTDWNTFNSKQNALTLGNVSEVVSNVLMFPDGGTGKTIGNLSIQVVQASASTNGFLSSTNWTTFNNKQNAITGAATTITTSDLTASRALISNASGKVDVSTVTSTELGYLSGVTSAIQTQLNTKASSFTGTTNYIAKFTSSSAIGNSLIFDNGTSVGIGTATPSTFLHIIGANTSNRGQLSIQSNNTSNAAKMSFYYDTTLQGNIGTVSSDFYLESINNLSIYAGGAERLKVTTGGNLQIKHSTSDTGIEMFYNGTTSTGAMLADANNFVIGGQTGKGLVFCTNNLGQEKMRIDTLGRVGIGITSPSVSLDVSGAGKFSSTVTAQTGFKLPVNGNGTSPNIAYNNSIGFGISGTGIFFGNLYNSDLSTAIQFRVTNPSGTDITSMTINPSGNIGIGTTSPGHKLDIVNAGGTSLRLANTANSSDSFIQYDNTATNFSVGVGSAGWFFYTGQTKRYDFWIANVIQLQLASSGNLLLGTTSDPGYKLYVNGQIYATSNITANSDLTLKKNLKLVENPIDKLNKLNGYLYQWKKNDEYQYGVIAQEVEKILPYAVTTGKDGIKGVSYNQIIPVLIEAVKELNAEVKLLKAK
jgi:hypothetical protein